MTDDRVLQPVPDPAAPAVTVRVPAKVNLALSVGPLRADGYHELTTVFHAVSLYDDVTLRAADRLSVEVLGEGADDVPTDGSNLAVRAVRAVAELLGVAPDVRVTIRKGIPVAGGMAGGSADAAAALLAADALWSGGLDRDALSRLAADLGSDVPFALQGGTALGCGRGEQLSPVLGRGGFDWVFALADGGLSTPAVYGALDAMRDEGAVEGPGSVEGVLAALRTGDAVALGRTLTNDLEPAALRLRPQLRRVLDAGREIGAAGAVVSGSGPTVAFLMRAAGEGVHFAAALAGLDVCRGIRRAQGPVSGAQLLSPEQVADESPRSL